MVSEVPKRIKFTTSATHPENAQFTEPNINDKQIISKAAVTRRTRGNSQETNIVPQSNKKRK